nr:immunoglobulin light chain junction region [Macaca mulatta]
DYYCMTWHINAYVLF